MPYLKFTCCGESYSVFLVNESSEFLCPKCKNWIKGEIENNVKNYERSNFGKRNKR